MVPQILIALCLLALTKISNCFFDPLSFIAGLGALNYKFAIDHSYCRFYECCNENWIPANIKELANALDKNIFGQHIVRQNLVPALKGHFSHSKKPLAISFHGTPGTGKTYVINMTANSIYKLGAKSKYVHIYTGGQEFRNDVQANVPFLQDRISQEISAAISDCPRSMFIFEEVDKMAQGIFDTLTTFLDHSMYNKGADYSKAIFIFNSNSAGVQISDKLTDLMKSGKLREETKLSDFEKTAELVAYNKGGGMIKTTLIESQVIDHYIPFLPLERTHVEKCLEVLLRRLNSYPNPAIISDIFDQISFQGPFAKSGCKRLEAKVIVAVTPS